MLPFLLFAMGVVGALLGALVLRADPRRWDNRFFAISIFLDAALAALRSVLILGGFKLFDAPCLRASAFISVFIAYSSAEFAYSFPSGRRAPRLMRLPALAFTIACAALILHPAGFAWFAPRANYFFFMPFFVAILAMLWKNWRSLGPKQQECGIPLVMAGLAFRWTSAMTAHVVGKSLGPETFSKLLELDATVGLFLGYLLFGQAVLRYNLFRVRGVVADILLYAGFGVAMIGLVAGSVDAALRMPPGAHQRLLLVGIAVLPIGLVALARWLKPRVENALLSPIDPRRGLAKTVLERVARGSEREVRPEAIVALTVAGLAELTGGSAVFLRGPAHPEAGEDAAPTSDRLLGPALARRLASGETWHLRPAEALDLAADEAAEHADAPADLVVAVRRGGALYGALSVDGGHLDRDTVAAVVTLAEHLALKLENCGLFAQMLALRGELEESRRLASLGSFAAAIAHDIRTPLTSVQMNVQILRGKVDLPADDMEYFDIALDELRRLNGSVQEILDYAKPVDLKPSAVELSGIADEAAKRMAPLLEERRLSLETRLGAALPPVLADAQRIRQVLINLLDNAAQASKEGASIVVLTRSADDGRVAIEVADHGKGIRAEDLPKIFEPFFTTRADGTGLGLAIAQKLVRAHGGEIKVDSAPGRGSTFTVLLPRAPAIGSAAA